MHHADCRVASGGTRLGGVTGCVDNLGVSLSIGGSVMIVSVDLSSVIRTITSRLDAELQGTDDISHRASKGRARESLLIEQVLRRVLPETVGLVHGAEIACSNGTTSGECDLVVYDRDMPLLYRADSFTVLPIEAVLGVIEVKSFLSQRELAKAIESAHRIKAMPTSAIQRDPGDVRRVRRHDRIWETFPVSAHVIAFDSIDLRTLANHLREAEDGRPRWECLESVFVLAKGVITDASQRQRGILGEASREGVITAMVIEFMSLFQRGWAPRFNPVPYLGSEPLGTWIATLGSWAEDGSQLNPGL